MTTYAKKLEISRWAENTLTNQLQKLVSDGTEVSSNKSHMSESTYIRIENDGLDIWETFRISDHDAKDTTTITIRMTEGNEMRSKKEIKLEIINDLKRIAPELLK